MSENQSPRVLADPSAAVSYYRKSVVGFANHGTGTLKLILGPKRNKATRADLCRQTQGSRTHAVSRAARRCNRESTRFHSAMRCRSVVASALKWRPMGGTLPPRARGNTGMPSLAKGVAISANVAIQQCATTWLRFFPFAFRLSASGTLLLRVLPNPPSASGNRLDFQGLVDEGKA